MSFNLSDFMASVPMDSIADPTKPKKGQPMQQPVAQPAPPVDPVEHYLNTYKQPAESTQTDPVQHYLNTYKPQTPGFMDRVGSAFTNVVTHPVDALESAVIAPAKSFFDAVVSPGVGEARHDPRLSKGGNSSGAPINGPAYDAEHGAVTGTFGGQRGLAGLQTVINTALPGAAARYGLLGTAAGSAAAGAAYNPDDPGVGATAGAALGTALHAAGKAAQGIGTMAVDRAGRPMETQQVRAFGVPLATIEGLGDKATRLNVQDLGTKPTTDGLSPFTDKPAAVADVLGTSGVRAARAMKVSSPVAESVAKNALQGRADDAVSRVIAHGLETTGLQTRQSGLRLVNDLIDQRSQEADAIWPDIYARNAGAIDDPRIAQVFNTESGRKAWREVPGLMSDRFLSTPDDGVFATGNPADDKSVMFGKLVQLNGGDVNAAMKVMRALGESQAPTSGAAVPPMNVQQLHFWAKALDDMGEPGFNRGPGSTGNRYNRGVGIQNLSRTVRQIMKDNAPDVANAMQQYADKSDLVRAGELGTKLFQTDPNASAVALEQMSPSEQEVFRRAGFDALAQRIENGPTDVERGVSKTRDKVRMRLLFPDQDSFNTFRAGLAEEGQMHANEQTVLGGSPTADKLADIAEMAGVSLPDVVRAAATGRWHRLMGQAAATVTRKALGAGADRLTTERMNQLMTGANGDLGARNDMLARYGIISPQQPPRTATAWTQGSAIRNPDLLSTPTPAGPALGGGPIPSGRRLPSTTPTVGEFQQGQAMPLRTVPERRLASGGPSPVPTAGTSPLGPAIPLPGQTFDAAVQQAVMNLYRKNPEWAVTLTREQQSALETQVRQTLMGGAPSTGGVSFMDVVRSLRPDR